MKYFLKKLYCTLVALILFISLNAQELPKDSLLPFDAKVRIGKLDNGFTYYIRSNNKPENRVEMRLAVNAGSILENESQLGLAHMVEHMCFNGTKHFAKNELVEYLQSIGIRFGADLNAYTSFDETVYMLTIPSDSVELVEKGFLVMEDWAHNVSFDTAEIDKERGVIVEEWRLGRGPWQRMLDKYLPVVFKDSHYADRLPIGKKEIIENAPYDTLRKFYTDWYRPDLMALVVVGDIDLDRAEKEIKDHFSKLTMPANPRERVTFEVPDQANTLVSITTDKEVPVSAVQLFYKSDVKISKTYNDYLEMLRYTALTGMLNQRLAELMESENPPFINSAFEYGSLWARTKNGLQGFAVVSETGIESGIQAVLVENERLSKFGFTQGEMNRYKLDLVKRYEMAFNERDKTESDQLANELVRNYLEEEPVPGIEFEYRFVKDNIDALKLTDINLLAKELIKDANRVIVVNAPEREGLVVPTEARILEIAAGINQTEIAAYVDKVSGNTLMKELPKAGNILSSSVISEIGVTDIKLSNGVRIILKPTDFKNDEVMLTAFCKGGHSVYPDADHFTAMNADGIVDECGVADYSPSDIHKILAGKSVYVAPSINYSYEMMSAQSKSSDLESMFQLLHLYFTQPRVDEGAFNSYVSKKKDLYENAAKDPENYFYDQYNRFRSQNNKRGDYLPTAEDWQKIDFKRAIEIYKDRFANAGNFTFIMVGAFSVDSVKPLLAQYLGSLPSIDRPENFIDLGIRPPKTKEIHNVYKGNDPKSLALIYFEEEKPWNQRDAFMVSVLGEILGFRYIEKLREEMSGVYSVRARASLVKEPYAHSGLQLTIPCSPDNVDSLISAALAEIRIIQKKGVEEKEIVKAKEIRKRQLENNLKENNYWLNSIQSALMNGTDLNQITNDSYISEISSEEMTRVANTYFNLDKYLQVVLYPESYKEKLEK